MFYKGLNEDEVTHSRMHYGSNRLNYHRGQTFWEKYWSNFNDPIITVLLIALCVNVFFSILGKVEWYETVGILLAVLISTFVSTISEYSNENAFREIQKSAADISCKVYRSGKLDIVAIDDIVVGDMVLLQAGDMIPADGYIEDGVITVDQSTLNGETREMEKTPQPQDYIHKYENVDFWDKHKIFRGTVVCGGECVMNVTHVGTDTIYGNLTNEIQIENRESPIKIKLSNLAKRISTFGYVGGIIIGLLYLFQAIVVNNGFNINNIMLYLTDTSKVLSNAIEALILGIVVIVMAVPEGLPLMIAIVCSLNMKKMFKDNVLVRKLVGIETAGSLNILFSDKTGTITKGELEVINFVDGEKNEYAGIKDMPYFLRRMVCASVLGNSSAQISDGKIIGGNATEKALLMYVQNEKTVDMQKIKQFQFNSRLKYSASIVNIAGTATDTVSSGKSFTLIKGASEKILPNCRYYYDKSGNKAVLDNIQALDKIINSYAEKSIRVLALAVSEQKAISEKSFSGDAAIPQNLVLVGLACIKDEVRPEALQAISDVQNAGIQVVMITGDKKETAVAIAKEAGLIQNENDIVLTSSELQLYTDQQIKNMLKNIRVIARALPNDKSRLVKIAQEMNLVVGMTGDGVNDSPALRRADVGFAMGSGTEVAKEAGDIVILDDNFLSIKKAVLYGRTIYNSIKKFITFQLTINFAAVFTSVLASLLRIERPIDITQLLWINLVMDTLGALAFGGEPALSRYLSERPKRRDENIIDKNMWSAVIVNSLFICALSMFFFLSSHVKILFRQGPNNIYLYTGYFAFFIFVSVFNGFSNRTDKVDLLDNISINKGFLVIMFFISVVQIMMTYFGGTILRTAGLVWSEWITVMSLAVLIIPIDALRKFAVLKIKKRMYAA